MPGQPLPGGQHVTSSYITHHTASHLVMSRGVTRLSTGSDGSRRKCCLQWCGGRLKLSGTNFLLAPRRGELGWAGVCVSSHEGDDVCVYVAIVAMSLQYLHEPQCHSLVQVFLSLAVCGSVHNLLMVLSSSYRDLQLTAGLVCTMQGCVWR